MHKSVLNLPAWLRAYPYRQKDGGHLLHPLQEVEKHDRNEESACGKKPPPINAHYHRFYLDRFTADQLESLDV